MEKRSPHISRFAVLSLSHTKSRTERNGFARFQPRILLLRCEESTSFREWKSSRYLLLFLFFFRSISAGDFYHEASSWDRARVLRCNYRCDIIVSDSRLKTLYWFVYLQPKPGSDGTYPRDKAKAVSGEKLLRSIMQDSKIELYATYVSLTLLSLLAVSSYWCKCLKCLFCLGESDELWRWRKLWNLHCWGKSASMLSFFLFLDYMIWSLTIELKMVMNEFW